MKPTRLCAAMLALSLTVASAAAHSTKKATEPSDGALLKAAPSQIAMQFDMPLRVTLITLTDQDGTAHDLTRSDDMQPVSDFTATPADLPPGRYTVDWRGLADDGHPMQGRFHFEIAE
ncbi:MAG: copper resistance protein CopC [Rhodobacteraceae bacterium]|nr:copper resistance protein CopC [Paracoccaceae bacterium]